MIDKRIEFDEAYIDKENETVTFYFIAPREMLINFFISCPNAVSMEISVEFPIDYIEGSYGKCSVSPTILEDDEYSDIDWRDVDLPEDEIEELIDLAARELVPRFLRIAEEQAAKNLLDTLDSISKTNAEAKKATK